MLLAAFLLVITGALGSEHLLYQPHVRPITYWLETNKDFLHRKHLEGVRRWLAARVQIPSAHINKHVWWWVPVSPALWSRDRRILEASSSRLIREFTVQWESLSQKDMGENKNRRQWPLASSYPCTDTCTCTHSENKVNVHQLELRWEPEAGRNVAGMSHTFQKQSSPRYSFPFMHPLAHSTNIPKYLEGQQGYMSLWKW